MSTISVSMVELDQTLMESLPPVQRQKLGKRMRQEQVKRYHQWAEEPTYTNTVVGCEKRANKKGTGVTFEQSVCLLEAADRFDNQEGTYDVIVFSFILFTLLCGFDDNYTSIRLMQTARIRH